MTGVKERRALDHFLGVFVKMVVWGRVFICRKGVPYANWAGEGSVIVCFTKADTNLKTAEQSNSNN